MKARIQEKKSLGDRKKVGTTNEEPMKVFTVQSEEAIRHIDEFGIVNALDLYSDRADAEAWAAEYNLDKSDDEEPAFVVEVSVEPRGCEKSANVKMQAKKAKNDRNRESRRQ